MVNQTYSPNKTVTLTEDNLSATNKVSSSSTTDTDSKSTYLSHKTITLTTADSITTNEKKEETTIENKPATANKESVSPINTATTKDNYPSYKTVSLTDETASEKKEEKPKENTLNTDKNSFSSPIINNSGTLTNYPSHKTINLGEGTTSNNKEEKAFESTVQVDTKTSATTETKLPDNTRIQPLQNSTVYPDHKSVTISNPEISSIDPTLNNQQNKDTSNITSEQKDRTENYQVSKTVVITNESKTDSETISISERTTKSVTNENISVVALGYYLAHKSYSFIKDDSKTSSIQIENISTSSETTIKKTETIIAENKKPAIAAATVTTTTKAKKPVLWIVLSSVLLLASGTLGWFSYTKEKSLQAEISVLKENKEDLKENLKRLQKDKLHFDDLITRGGKIDPKNNIQVVDAAAESEAIRICFSISSNHYATKGKKTVYIRLIDQNKNVLVKSKENLFEYREEQIPYSLMEEVEYKGQELMLCFDYKPEEKLQAGTYTAEVYNEGVLDGTTTFELK